MSEFTCQFGDDNRLTGIVTRPTSHSAEPTRAVVLVGAGLVPKAGPFRLYAELARRLAQAGFTTLRFDLSGIGDSPRSLVDRPLRERTELDLRAAVDYLGERHRPAQIVLGGLCSGAEDSFRFAELDQRITGVFMIDPFAYRTAGWRWRHLVHRVMRKCSHKLGLHLPVQRRERATSGRRNAPLVSYSYMPRDESTRILTTLLKRRVRVHFAYTGGASEVFNHEGQLQAMFEGTDLRELVTLDHLPRLDHTQALAAHRRSLVEAIVNRLSEGGERVERAKSPRAS